MKPYSKFYLLFFFTFSYLICYSQTEKKILVLNEKGEQPKTGTEQCYLHFNNKNNIIKRKIEEGELAYLSTSANIAAIVQFKYISPLTISIYNDKGSLLKKINNDTNFIGGWFVFSDDGRFAYFKPTFIDEIGSAPAKLILYSKEVEKIKEHDELFSSNMISTFSKSGNFAVFLRSDPENINNGKLMIFDTLLSITGVYIFSNFNYKMLNITKDPIKFDSDERIIISTYDLKEYEDSKKNELIRYRIVVDRKGNFIKKVEGWEN